MSTRKPGKKSGAKATKPPQSGVVLLTPDQAREIAERARSGGGLTDLDRLRVLNAAEDAKPVANSKNPNSYVDLLPSEGGYRRDGIWKKSIDAVIDVEQPDDQDERDIHKRPAGLSNLGNTCYANSALQLLFTNQVFRDAVYRIEDDVVRADGSGLLHELRKLFLELEFGVNSTVDPSQFANVLKLQASEQQDAQEFQKLLMQCLEERMATSQNPSVCRPSSCLSDCAETARTRHSAGRCMDRAMVFQAGNVTPLRLAGQARAVPAVLREQQLRDEMPEVQAGVDTQP
jgi:Ubiquitin carboxyl-terminal hydrolase